MSLAEALSMRAQVPALPNASPSDTQFEAPSVRTAVNRRNAARSTGPATEAGKSISSLNALKTGLTGRTVLLHSDDLAEYQRHLAEYESEFKPEGLRERELVQSLADTEWRLARIARLEMAIYAKDRAESLSSCDHPGESAAHHLLELETFLKYEKQLRNLQLQESRLLRRSDKDRKELAGLQAARQTPPPASEEAAKPHAASQPHSGFEFSVSEKTASGVAGDILLQSPVGQTLSPAQPA